MFSKERNQTKRQHRSENRTKQKNKRANLLDVHILEICERYTYRNEKKNQRRLRIRPFELYGPVLYMCHQLVAHRSLDYNQKHETRKAHRRRAGRIVTIITVVIICCIGAAQVLNCHNKPHIIFIVLWPFFFHELFNRRLNPSNTQRIACTDAPFDGCIDSSNCMILVLTVSSCDSCASNFTIKHFDVFVVFVVVFVVVMVVVCVR